MKGYWIIGLTLAALLAASGCAARKPSKAAVPVTPVAGAVSLPVPEEEGVSKPPAAEEGGEPGFGYERVVVPPLQPAEPREAGGSGESADIQSPEAVKPQPAKRPPPAASVKAPETDAGGEADAAKPANSQAPSLKPMLSENERRQLDALILANLERARRNFSLIREDRLGVNERSVFDEARRFAARAAQLRASDPAVASSLAERAAILTQELLRKQ